MDNEAIVDQIVKSLSFEVVAVPQHANQIDSTSKSTPLNVKIRVRKKHGTDLRHGVLSMPKVDTKTDGLKNESAERVRLVSSDHTIMNFNMLMEADFDKTCHKQNLNLISPGLEANIENPNLSNIVDSHTAPVLSKRTKDIFGKCKPGGCLDPPFGEDKYSYQPTHQNLSSPVKEDSSKLRSSSIFKNNIFKRKKKSSQSDDNFDVNNNNEGGLITSLNQNDSVGTFPPYSDAIITYPHPSNSTELHKYEEKKSREESFRKRYSSDEKSKTSSIDDGSYFVIPKKTKKASNQSNNSYTSKIQKKYTTVDDNNEVIMKLRDETISENKKIFTTSSPKNTQDNKTDELQITSQAHSFVPIPLIIPINTPKNTTLSDNETLNMDIEQKNITHENSIIVQDDTTVSEKKSPLYVHLDTKNKVNISKPENDIQVLKGNESLEILPKQSVIDKRIDRQDSKHDEYDVSRNTVSTTLNDYFIESNADNVVDNGRSSKDQIILKSQFSLTHVRDTSLLDVTTDVIDQTISTHNVIENRPKTDTDTELNEIWENKSEAIKSKADFIMTKKMPPKEDSRNEVDNLDATEYLLPNIEEEHLEFENNTEKSVGNKNDPLDSSLGKKSSTHEIITYTDLLHKEGDAKNIEEKNKFISEKNLFDQININDIKSHETMDNIQDSTIIEKRDNMLNDNSTTRFDENKINILPKEIVQNLNSPESVDTSKLDENKSFDFLDTISDIIDEYLTTKEPNNPSVLEKQNNRSNIFDNSHSDEIKDAVKIKEKSVTSFFEDDNVTVKGLYPYKGKRSVSDLSIMGSGSLTNTLGEQDNSKSLKIRSSSDQEKTINMQTEEGKILNNIPFNQTSHSDFLERQKPELKTQFDESNFRLYDQIPTSTGVVAEMLHKTSNISQPTSILRPGVVSWKMDIALQSYVDENNERIIKSFDSNVIPERRKNDTSLVAKCYLGDDFNEIKIPIDQNNNLSVKIVNNKTQHKTQSEFNANANSADEILGKKKIKLNVSDTNQHLSEDDLKDSEDINNTHHGEKKIKIRAPDTDSVEKYTNSEESSKSEVNKYEKTLTSGDIRNALNYIYEEELVPLQDIIKGLREEIDDLAANQMKLNMQNVTPKRSKPIKLVHLHKKCCCLRRF